MKTVIAISIIAIALIAVACTGTPPAEPGWPADAVTYMREASPLHTQIATSLPVGWLSGESIFTDMPIDAEEAREWEDEIGDALMAILDLEPPPALLPYHESLLSAARKCRSSLDNAAWLNSDPNSPAYTLAIIILRGQCIDALAIVRLELARYAATVGGYPPKE